MGGPVSSDSRPRRDATDVEQVPTRSEAQEVASGQADETPAVLLVSVIATLGALVLVVLALAALAYWLA